MRKSILNRLKPVCTDSNSSLSPQFVLYVKEKHNCPSPCLAWSSVCGSLEGHWDEGPPPFPQEKNPRHPAGQTSAPQLGHIPKKKVNLELVISASSSPVCREDC